MYGTDTDPAQQKKIPDPDPTPDQTLNRNEKKKDIYILGRQFTLQCYPAGCSALYPAGFSVSNLAPRADIRLFDICFLNHDLLPD